ncbi:MAG TPA: penicillin-binding protein 2 [Fimbriimonadaceae bacterium]|nr:penicillin-binding protein 2 [Fimbriimonadaceae bacterium]
MSVIHQEKQNRLDLRQLMFPAVLLGVFLVFFFRLWYLQVMHAPALIEKADTFRNSTIPKAAPRGRVLDRNGVLLAGVRPEIVVTALPGVVKKHPESIDTLATMLGAPKEDLLDKIKEGEWRPFAPTPVFMNAPIDVATRVAEKSEELPGLGVETMPMRYYPDTVSFSHLLGYVGVPSEKNVERIEKWNVEPADYVGKIGLEYIYERELMGAFGSEEMEVDARRRPLRTIERSSPLPGKQLILGLDAELQKFATDELTRRGFRGAVAAVDPRSGEVLTLCSNPTYDAGQFLGGISRKEFAALNSDPGKPLLNRAIYSAYAPGSTFKIVTTIAAMQTGHFSPTQTFFCPGYYRMGRRNFKCLGNHGAVAFERAMAKSCNTYFISLGMKAGPEAIQRACADLGLGKPTGVDLLGEGKGFVPSMDNIDRWSADGKWWPGDTANFSVGQGAMAVTPLQMASVIALVANRGISYRPHLVRAVVEPGDQVMKPVQPQVLGRVEASDAFWSTLQRGLVQVIEGGTATRVAKTPGLTWGGKTGSAENRRDSKTHSWFVAFAPADDPKIAICVMLENAGHGSDAAAPVAAAIVRHYLAKTGR